MAIYNNDLKYEEDKKVYVHTLNNKIIKSNGFINELKNFIQENKVVEYCIYRFENVVSNTKYIMFVSASNDLNFGSAQDFVDTNSHLYLLPCITPLKDDSACFLL